MELKEKILKYFEGRIVRKDLSKEIKGNAVVPTYVLEYLLGQYCATSDEEIIKEGVIKVKDIIRNHFVHRDEAQIIKSTIKEKGNHKIIDKVSVRLNDSKGIYEAFFSNLGINRALVDSDTIKKHPRLLSSGVWCIIDISYVLTDDRGTSPWIIDSIKPIQISNVDIAEYKEARQKFSKEEWIDLLMQSIGLNPKFFNFRTKLIQLSRLIPFCENNYNLIELGPKGTGKSHIFSEMSPHGILVSGGDVTQAKLFVNNNSGDIGLVGYWDVVAFDEFAGKTKRVDKKLVDIMKNYLANKSFSRGTDIFGASASMAFVGNTDKSVQYMLKNEDLFISLPQGYYDSAFLDRLHCYLPGWEVKKLRNEMYTIEYGFIVDYLAEVLKEFRKEDFTTYYRNYFELSDSLTTRDKDGITKTFSGLVKILYPDGNCTPDEIKELLDFAIESRKRVKDQLIKIDETFEQVDFGYSSKESGETINIETLENEIHGIKKADKEETIAEPIQNQIEVVKNKIPTPGHLIIRDNQTGISFKKLFADYITDAKEITLTDPYIRLPYQFKLLMEFCSLISELKVTDTNVMLKVITWNAPEYIETSQEILEEISDTLKDINIDLTFEFKDVHDRSITTDTGWKIILGRGLDIYDKYEGKFNIADQLQETRQCKGCEITYLRMK